MSDLITKARDRDRARRWQAAVRAGTEAARTGTDTNAQEEMLIEMLPERIRAAARGAV